MALRVETCFDYIAGLCSLAKVLDQIRDKIEIRSGTWTMRFGLL